MDKFIAHLNVKGSTVDITCDTLDALIEMTNRVTGAATETIKPIDAPDVGVPVHQPVVDMQQAQASLVFGGARTPEQQVADHAAGANAPTTTPGLPESLLTPQVDSEGMRWDSRIHSSTKTTVASGAWRMRKGVDPALVEQVKAEQRALNALPAAPSSDVPPVPASVSAPPVPAAPSSDVPPVPVAAVSAPPVPVVPVAAPPVPVVQAQITDFGPFCEWLNGPMLAVPPKLTLDDVNAVVRKYGMNALPDLLQRADYIPVVHGELAALVASR